MLTVGVILLVVAVLLMLGEAHMSTGGLIASVAVLALTGAVTLLLLSAGAGLLAPLAGAAGVLAPSLVGLLVLRRSLRSARSRRPRAGAEAMIGHVGVLRAGTAGARVFVDGGLWRARPGPLEDASALHDGDRVVVERIDGLTLGVRRAEEWELNP